MSLVEQTRPDQGETNVAWGGFRLSKAGDVMQRYLQSDSNGGTTFDSETIRVLGDAGAFEEDFRQRAQRPILERGDADLSVRCGKLDG
jgi:hypothetical protein